MKKLSTKRTLSLIAAAVIGTSAFAGCGSTQQSGLEGFSNRPNKVSVVYNQNAYGKEWITQIANEYMTNYNEDTYIELKQTPTPSEEFSKIQTDSAPADLYFFDQHLKDLKGHAADVTDVWDSYATGESAKKIKDKLVPLLANQNDYYGVRDFSMPYSQATTYGWVYNKTVLDAAFPDGYTMPRTTDELFEFGDSLKTIDLAGVEEDQDVYLMVCSLADTNENLRYSQQTWFAQIMGAEKYEKYYDGRYWDETEGKYMFDESKPTAYEVYKDELMAYYDILWELMTKANGYVHKDSASMNYNYASGMLAGAGFKQNKSKVVFKVDAPYFESEAKMFLDGMKNKGQEQTLGIMAFPVASAIIDRLDSVNDDATLRSVIDYVDGKTTEAPAGVSEADIDAIAEARGMVGVYTGGGMVIPKTAANKEGAKDFMRFLCSDAAAIVSAKASKGLEILPYGKVVSDAELGFEKTPFLQEVSVWMTKNTFITSSDAAFSTYTDWSIGQGSNQDAYGIFNGGAKEASVWWQNNYTFFDNRWETMVNDYKVEGFSTAN